jgi:hypothetical protein
MIRTDKGMDIYRNALQQGYIEEVDYEDIEERKISKTKMLAKIISFSKRKKLRAEMKLRKVRS